MEDFSSDSRLLPPEISRKSESRFRLPEQIYKKLDFFREEPFSIGFLISII